MKAVLSDAEILEEDEEPKEVEMEAGSQTELPPAEVQMMPLSIPFSSAKDRGFGWKEGG